MNLTESEWVCTGESRRYRPYRVLADGRHLITKNVIQQKWTRKVRKEIESQTELYAGMFIEEVEVEWRDIPIVEEV